MSAIDQLGFDFADESAPAWMPSPAGTWLDLHQSTGQWAALFAEALKTAWTMTETYPTGALFVRGVQAGEFTLAAMAACATRTGSYSLWGIKVPTNDADRAAFLNTCLEVKTRGGQDGDREARTYHSAAMDVYALHVRGAGTLVLRDWHSAGFGMMWEAGRSADFLDSYADNAPRFLCAEHVWKRGQNCQRLAEAHDKVPTVRTVEYAGRPYVVCGAMYGNRTSECQAWSFRAIGKWKGPIYTYQTHIAAYDNGSIERGDHRGLVVNVSGQLAVLDGFAVFYDDNPDRAQIAAAMDDAGEDEECEIESDCMEE